MVHGFVDTRSRYPGRLDSGKFIGDFIVNCGSDDELINSLTIAAPCPVSWQSMDGDERVRHCGHCKLNVYNISEMSSKEASALIRDREGERLCIRLYRRLDGTVITNNCPVGLRWLRRAAQISAVAAVAAIVWLGFMDGASAQGLVGAPADPGMRVMGTRLEGIPKPHVAGTRSGQYGILDASGIALNLNVVLAYCFILFKFRRRLSFIALAMIFVTIFAVHGALTANCIH